MSHEFETGFFVAQPAWHGLGKVVTEAPSVRDAIAMAGLDWTVTKEPVKLASDGRVVPDVFATVRSSDRAILGTVGPMWTPLQNNEAFAWFEPLVTDGSVQLEAAGSLRGGQRVWVLAKTGTTEVQKGDPIEQYVLLSNGHDGKLAVRVGFTTVRVVCANTLKLAHDTDANKLIRVQHFSNVVSVLEDIRDLMNIAQAEFEGTAEQMRALTKKRCNTETLRRYVREVFAPGKSEDEKAAKLVLPKVEPLFEEGRGAELSRGTMWGAFNAVTEFVTHERGRSEETRLDSQWFGSGAQIVNRALTTALEFDYFESTLSATESPFESALRATEMTN